MEVGDVARRTRKVRPDDIELFAAMTGDRNPVHFDAELAAQSRFGGIVVQGGVTTGLLNALVAQDLPGPGSVFLRTDWNYRAPVRPGDVLTAEATVLAIRPDKPISTLQTTVRNSDDLIVLDGTVVVWRDPHVAAVTDRRSLNGSTTNHL
jgi:acyl dehydratase